MKRVALILRWSALTAHADEATIERATKTEPHGYLLKPVKTTELRSAIEVSVYRHGMESRLRASEERYRRIIETTHEGVCLFDADLRCTFANRRMGEILGYEPGESLGKGLFDLLDEQQRSVVEENIERRRRGEPGSGEVGAKRKDGTSIWGRRRPPRTRRRSRKLRAKLRFLGALLKRFRPAG